MCRGYSTNSHTQSDFASCEYLHTLYMYESTVHMCMCSIGIGLNVGMYLHIEVDVDTVDIHMQMETDLAIACFFLPAHIFFDGG